MPGVLSNRVLWASLVYYSAIGVVLHFTRGSYDLPGLLVVLAGWAALSAHLFAKEREILAPEPEILELCFWGVLVFFGYKLLRNDMVHVIDSKHCRHVMKAFLWGSFALSCGGLLQAAIRLAQRPADPDIGGLRLQPRLQTTLCLLIGGCLFAAKILAILTSRHPTIDVFTISSAGADYLRHGINPYAQAYPDIYHGAYGYVPTYCYWPGALLPQTLCKWIFGDVRCTFILADAITAIGLCKLARSLHWPKRLSVLLPLLWLSFPATLFVLDQSWIDTLLVTSATLFALFALRERWIAAGIALGAFCATKQYSVFFGVLSLFLVFSTRKKDLAKTTTAAALTFAALLVPFALWDWHAFYGSTIAEFLVMPAREDALSLIAAARHLAGWTVPAFWEAAIDLAALSAAAAFLLRRKGSLLKTFEAWTAGLVLVYGATFLFGKQAFCNYYYLLAYFVLLELMFCLPQTVKGTSE